MNLENWQVNPSENDLKRRRGGPSVTRLIFIGFLWQKTTKTMGSGLTKKNWNRNFFQRWITHRIHVWKNFSILIIKNQPFMWVNIHQFPWILWAIFRPEIVTSGLSWGFRGLNLQLLSSTSYLSLTERERLQCFHSVDASLKIIYAFKKTTWMIFFPTGNVIPYYLIW